MAKRSLLAMAVVLLLILMSVSVWAVPTSMNYQGKLTDKDGKPLNGSYNMTFYLFTLPSGGSAIWTENHPSVQVTDGIYNVELGGLTLDLFENNELYLEVEVGGETLEPRQHLTSSAFSMRSAKAEDAETLDGKDSSEFSASVHSHSFGDITGTATDGQIPNDITINNAATADYANTADSADYADSAGNADTVDGEHASAFADAVHTHGFNQITGSATDGQIPDNITINYAASAGNADTVDGLHASSFLSTSSDYGRSGVSSTLYEGSTALSNKYVGKSGSQTIASGTLTVNTPLGIGAADEIGVKGYAQSETYGSGVFGQATGSQGYGVYGSASGSSGRGVYGENSASGNYGYLGDSGVGVYGYSSSSSGVYGYGSGSSYGVYGYNSTSTSYGSLGSSSNVGVFGSASATGGRGVYGENSTSSNYGYLGSSSYGVYGSSSSGYAGYFIGRGYFSGNLGIGKTSPGFRLDVAGRARMLTGSDNSAGIWFTNADDSENRGFFGMQGNDLLGFFGQGGTPGWGLVFNVNSKTVGIGTLDPGFFKLAVNGDAAKVGSAYWASFSDARLKDIGERYKLGLEEITKIEPVRYRYKEDNALGLPSEGEYVGLVAQEVQEVIPEAVEQNKQGYLMVNEGPINYAMLNAIKELSAEVKRLKKRIEELEKR